MSNFQLTRDQVINGALRICGVVDPEESATANQLSTAAEALNTMVAAWENEGLPLWKTQEHIISLVGGQTTYTISTDRPLEVTNAVLRNNTSPTSPIDITMVRLSRSDYWTLGNKEALGYPTQWYYEYGANSGSMYLYPTPDPNVAPLLQLILYYQAPYNSTSSGTDIPDFPSEFMQALKWGLAQQIMHEYNVPLQKMAMIEKRAEKEKDDAFGFNVEHTSVYFNWSKYGGYQ